ncbi:NUDIX domain-containing protein [Bacteroides thetaiotaomicron]|uniref:NUDIX domain-containing protein n=1 Tax=Bacteroides thetaiotaomicron TaxID=818 RepID=UPI00321BD751
MQNISAGLLVIHHDSILLVQQHYDVQGVHLSIPKGCIMDNESPIQAAIRETYEETGIHISSKQIDKTPYLITVRFTGTTRRIIYYLVRLNHIPTEIEPIDSSEILAARFIQYSTAVKTLQISQLSVLLHVYPDKIPLRALNWLIFNGYICRNTHPYCNLAIYNYTEKCKKHEYWNEITLWCRGIILDSQNYIRFKPLKKFFELKQLYNYFLPQTIDNFNLYEKKDGTLGILYWINNMPYITTRGSFTSFQALSATTLLYTKYTSVIHLLNKTVSYFFEIIMPEDKHIVDYGECRDLFLIGAYDNIKQQEITLNKLSDLPFKQVKSITTHLSLTNIMEDNKENEEGYVALFTNGQRIKIKFQSYKEKYAEKYQ